MRKHRAHFSLPVKAYFILLLPIGMLISYAASYFPSTVENFYSSGAYKSIGGPLSRITGIFPFSVAEILLGLLVLFCIWRIVSVIIKMLKQESKRAKLLANFIINIAVLSGIIYFAFLGLWGLNYHRYPFSVIAGMDIQPASVEQLVEVCEDIIQRANDLRGKVSEDSNGYMRFPGGYREVLRQAYIGYDRVSQDYPQLAGKYGAPKPVGLSKLMSYTGIWGVYFPFTAEANVNIAIPDSMKPATACHEMAHQRGFAREDEANYIASIACSANPSVEFQYSGLLSSLIHVMNEVYKHDPSQYKRLYGTFSKGVARDWVQIDKFNEVSEGVVGEISNKVNDTYLKANLQEDGVYSYGRMVDLLIAEYRKKSKL